jgi:hypothetical protein
VRRRINLAIRSVQLPTGSAINTSGRLSTVSRAKAAPNSPARQQNTRPSPPEPPSGYGYGPIAVSINRSAWSLVMIPLAKTPDAPSNSFFFHS